MTEEQAIERIAEAVADLHFRTIEDHGHNPASADIALVAWNEIKAIAQDGSKLLQWQATGDNSQSAFWAKARQWNAGK